MEYPWLDAIVNNHFEKSAAYAFPSIALPLIISVFATPPNTVNGSTLKLVLPAGYNGVAMTCVSLHFGYSTPIEALAWYKMTGSAQERKVSSTQVIDYNNMSLVVAELMFDEGFQSSDEGSYSCVLTNIAKTLPHTTFAFEVGVPVPSSPCPLNLMATHTAFQLRILNVQCKAWTSTQIEVIMAQLQRSLVGVLSSLCFMCSINTSTLVLSEGPSCSKMVKRAVVFNGLIMLSSSSRRVDAFCALSRWHQSGPTVFISDSLHSVDRECNLITSPNTPECGEPKDKRMISTAIVGFASGSVLFVAVIVLIVIVSFFLNR